MSPPDPLFAAVNVPRFIAQALVAARPELRDRAFVVAEQDPESSKTLVVEASDPAREEGIHPGLPLFWIRRKWPRALVAPRDVGAEVALRSRMTSLWNRLSPVFGVDGDGLTWIDLTGTPWSRRVTHDEPGMTSLAEKIRRAVMNIGIDTVSIGVSTSALISRVLARAAAPRGVRVCPSGAEKTALDPLDPLLLPGLSPGTRERLRKYDLARVETLRSLGKEDLTARFGAEGERLYALSRGMDADTIGPRWIAVKADTVLPRDVNDMEKLRNLVRLTADKLAHALRKNGSKAGRVTLILTYSDRKEVRRTARLETATAAFPPLADGAVDLFFELYKRRVALRRIRLSVAAPMRETGQRNLFEKAADARFESLEAAIDKIRRKRSFGAVMSGSNVEPVMKKARRAAPQSGRKPSTPPRR